MTIPRRPGMTVPLPGPLHTHRQGLAELADLGYTDIWSAEADGADGFTPLALAAAWEPRLRLGTAIIPAYTRSPACLAQCVASLADAAPGRVAVGIGSSSNVIIERWNGLPFERPYQKVRDVVRFLPRCVVGREGGTLVRHLHRQRVPSGRAPRGPSGDPRGGVARRNAAPRRAGGRRGDHQLALTRRRPDGDQGGARGRRRRRAGGGRPDLLLPEREHRGGAAPRPDSPSPPT
ncbi:MAG: LLM class flavin-dependent oxidoreductase [Ilumatobacteraceae bacterium]